MATIRSQSVSATSPAGNDYSPIPRSLIFTFFLSLTLRSPVISVYITPSFSLLDKKRKKEEGKVPVREVKAADGGKAAEEERKREKPKAHAPSHAKIRSIGRLRSLHRHLVKLHAHPVLSLSQSFIYKI